MDLSDLAHSQPQGPTGNVTHGMSVSMESKTNNNASRVMHWVFKIEVASVRRACNSTWDCATNVASFAQRFEPFITWWFSQIKTTCWLLKASIHFLQPGSSVGRHIPRKNLVRWAIAVIKVDSCTSLRFLKMEFLLKIGHWVWDFFFQTPFFVKCKCRAGTWPI